VVKEKVSFLFDQIKKGFFLPLLQKMPKTTVRFRLRSRSNHRGTFPSSNVAKATVKSHYLRTSLLPFISKLRRIVARLDCTSLLPFPAPLPPGVRGRLAASRLLKRRLLSKEILNSQSEQRRKQSGERERGNATIWKPRKRLSNKNIGGEKLHANGPLLK